MTERDLGTLLDELVATPDVDEGWAEITHRIGRDERRRTGMRIVAGLSAAAVVAVALAFAFRSGDHKQAVVVSPNSTAPESPSTDGPRTVSAPAGGRPMPSWKDLESGPLTPRRVSTMEWMGSELLVFGGFAGDGSDERSDGATYNPTSKQWTPIAAPPRSLSNAVHARHGREVVFFDLSGGLAWNADTDTWRELPAAPAPNIEEGTLDNAVVGDTLYMPELGYQLDLTTDTWTEMPKVPVAPELESLATDGSNIVLMSQGRTFVYDTSARSWDEVERAPGSPVPSTGRLYAAGNGHNYVFDGGRWNDIGVVPAYGTCTADFIEGDGFVIASSCGWSAASPIGPTMHWTPIEGTNPQAGVIGNGVAYAFGGPFSDALSPATENFFRALPLGLDEHGQVRPTETVGLGAVNVLRIPEDARFELKEAAVSSTDGTYLDMEAELRLKNRPPCTIVANQTELDDYLTDSLHLTPNLTAHRGPLTGPAFSGQQDGGGRISWQIANDVVDVRCDTLADAQTIVDQLDTQYEDLTFTP